MSECRNKNCHNESKFLVQCDYSDNLIIEAEICEYCAVKFKNVEAFNQKLIAL